LQIDQKTALNEGQQMNENIHRPNEINRKESSVRICIYDSGVSNGQMRIQLKRVTADASILALTDEFRHAPT